MQKYVFQINIHFTKSQCVPLTPPTLEQTENFHQMRQLVSIHKS